MTQGQSLIGWTLHPINGGNRVFVTLAEVYRSWYRGRERLRWRHNNKLIDDRRGRVEPIYSH